MSQKNQSHTYIFNVSIYISNINNVSAFCAWSDKLTWYLTFVCILFSFRWNIRFMAWLDCFNSIWVPGIISRCYSSKNKQQKSNFKMIQSKVLRENWIRKQYTSCICFPFKFCSLIIVDLALSRLFNSTCVCTFISAFDNFAKFKNF